MPGVAVKSRGVESAYTPAQRQRDIEAELRGLRFYWTANHDNFDYEGGYILVDGLDDLIGMDVEPLI